MILQIRNRDIISWEFLKIFNSICYTYKFIATVNFYESHRYNNFFWGTYDDGYKIQYIKSLCG